MIQQSEELVRPYNETNNFWLGDKILHEMEDDELAELTYKLLVRLTHYNNKEPEEYIKIQSKVKPLNRLFGWVSFEMRKRDIKWNMKGYKLWPIKYLIATAEKDKPCLL